MQHISHTAVSESRSVAVDDPFSTSRLEDIFKASEKHPDRVKSRESSHLEFKKSFSLGSLAKYGRTIAAFANAGGGHLVFGITPSPHRMEGLRDDRFDGIDPEKLTGFLNEHFAPEVRWDKFVHHIGETKFGLIYVFESHDKPVMCTRNSKGDGEEKADLKEGEIYYRYRGRSECIKYPDLRRLIDERRQHEQLIWMHHLKQIGRIGVQNAGIFDIDTGTVSGPGGTFVIDEALLRASNKKPFEA